ncbi:type II toxin-antitoxin system RelE/ParE family toxin [Gloeomargarita lithophora]|uniref:type II toxin-antitoxin system RelE/ParE family toxin n=1 Tax=Gloeomargarita lithophora TaxID=1188228 RepID=UPI000A02606D
MRIAIDGDVEAKFWKKLEQFIQNPFEPSLKTHKLSGKLKGLWSFSVDYSIRIIFYFTEDEKAIFVDIGNHNEVY